MSIEIRPGPIGDVLIPVAIVIGLVVGTIFGLALVAERLGSDLQSTFLAMGSAVLTAVVLLLVIAVIVVFSLWIFRSRW